MMRRNIAATLLKIVCKNLYSVKCYDKTNLKFFALSIWGKNQQELNLFWPVYMYMDFKTVKLDKSPDSG